MLPDSTKFRSILVYEMAPVCIMRTRQFSEENLMIANAMSETDIVSQAALCLGLQERHDRKEHERRLNLLNKRFELESRSDRSGMLRYL